MRNHFLHAYPRFSRKTRFGIISLLLTILVLTFLPFFLPVLYKPVVADYRKLESELKQAGTRRIDITESTTRTGKRTNHYEAERSSKGLGSTTLFYFDPNQLSEEGWLRLGVKEKTVKTIRNYLAKGGRFRTAGDLKKIWGMPAYIAEQLIPFVRIAAPETAITQQALQKQSESKKVMSLLDINSADTTAWIALPGIGSKLANRIVTFREKLGGFYHLEQLKETFGLKDSVYQNILPRLTLASTLIRQLNINTATLDELKSHPYIRYPLANAIIQYRQQHGDYRSPEELRKLVIMDEAALQKMMPYLRTN